MKKAKDRSGTRLTEADAVSGLVPTPQLPHVIRENVLPIFGVDLRVMVLSDGQRVIEANSAQRFFDALAESESPISDDDARLIAAFIKGRS